MTQTQQVNIFKIDQQKFTLPVDKIEQIVRVVELKSIPGLPKNIQGILNYHGDLIPVIDLRKKLKMEAKALSPEERMVIVSSCNRFVAIVVSEVLNIFELDLSKTFNATSMTGKKDLERLVSLENEIMFVYNTEHLLTDAEKSQLDNTISIFNNQRLTA